MTVVFSKNQGDFPSLEPSPGVPEPSTLKWELDNDVTLAASVVLVNGNIQLQTISGDVTAAISFTKNAITTAFLDLTAPEQAAVVAVLAAHKGLPVSAAIVTKSKAAAVPIPGDGAVYTVVETFQPGPLVAGDYQFSFSFNAEVTAGFVTFATDVLQVRVQFTDGDGNTNTRAQATVYGERPDSRYLSRIFTARAGEEVTVVLEAKGIQVGVDGQINRTESRLAPA